MAMCLQNQRPNYRLTLNVKEYLEGLIIIQEPPEETIKSQVIVEVEAKVADADGAKAVIEGNDVVAIEEEIYKTHCSCQIT